MVTLGGVSETVEERPRKAVSRFSREYRTFVRSCIGRRIKELRLARGETQAECSRVFGANESYFRQLECGAKDTSMWRYLEVADFFGVTLAELFKYVK